VRTGVIKRCENFLDAGAKAALACGGIVDES
jgi:hypothetical protein